MNILCVSDGSDGGYKTVDLLARIIDRRMVDKIKIVLVTWPQRQGALWNKAYGLWPAKHDLHQAMQITVDRELERFRAAFRDHAGSIETASAAGEPISEILKNAKLVEADLIFVAITGDSEAEQARRLSYELIAKSPTPVVIAYGRNNTSPQH